MQRPLVSVIIPAYNAQKYLSETIASVLNQEYHNLELIIVNDGSTDDTEKVILSFQDKRLQYIPQENKGCSGAKNTGLLASLGDFIQYLDADDLLSPDKIAEQVAVLLHNPYCVAICKTRTFTKTLSEQDSILIDPAFIYNADDTFEFLLNLYGVHGKSGMIQPNAFLISRALSDSAGSWDTSLSPAPDEDGEYFCRVMLAAEKIYFTPSGTNYYRKHAVKNSLSRQVSHLHAEGALRSIHLISQHMLGKENSERVKQTMAEHFSKFIYQYAMYKDLCHKAESEIHAFGLAAIPLAGGKNFRKLAKWIGFKNAIYVKRFFMQKRHA